MRSGADLRGGTPLVSFNHVIDPHFVTLSSSLYTTSRKPNPIFNPNLNPNSNRNPTGPGPTVIIDPQIGPIDPQIVTVQIRPAPQFVVCLKKLHEDTSSSLTPPVPVKILPTASSTGVSRHLMNMYQYHWLFQNITDGVYCVLLYTVIRIGFESR